jgi:uncharacterized protein GlcG (DUF336 family)
MMQRIDGTQLGSVDVAREGLLGGGLPAAHQGLRGLPITADGKVIGSIGVSGGTAPQDGQIAKAGIDNLK